MIVAQAFLHWVNIPIKRFSTLHGLERTKNDRGSDFSTLDKHKDPTFFGFAWPDRLKNDDDSDFSTLDKHKDSTFFGFAWPDRLKNDDDSDFSTLGMNKDSTFFGTAWPDTQKIDGDSAFSTLDKPKSLAPPRLTGPDKQDNYMDWFRLSVVIRKNYVFFVFIGCSLGFTNDPDGWSVFGRDRNPCDENEPCSKTRRSTAFVGVGKKLLAIRIWLLAKKPTANG